MKGVRQDIPPSYVALLAIVKNDLIIAW